MLLSTTALSFVGSFLGDTVKDFVSDQLKNEAQHHIDTLKKALKKQEIPINQNVQKAIRQCYLFAGLEATFWASRQLQFKQSENEEYYWETEASYRVIINYINSELHKIIHNNYIYTDKIADKTIFFNFTELHNSKSTEIYYDLQKTITNDLIIELELHLNDLKYKRNISGLLMQAIKDGWNDKGQHWSIFGIMCDHFQELIKTDERLRITIEMEWLADVKLNVKFLIDLLKNLGNNFLTTYGKIPDYFNEILDRLNPQPQLRNNYLVGNYSEFTYRSRYTPFIGREQESKILEDFFSQSELLSWCLLTGPGGSGKSRLALEFCNYIVLRHTVYTGFMQSDSVEKFDWSAWQPTCPTLIVIDYFTMNFRPVLKAIRILKERAELKQLSFAVKFILIERYIRGSWHEQIEREILIGQIPQLFLREPIELQPLDFDSLYSIIRYILEKEQWPLPNVDYIKSKLRDIDSLGRPLFAIFVGYALTEGVNLSNWDKMSLLNYMLQRHIGKIWLPSASQDKHILHLHLNLLAIATMLGGLNENQLENLLNKKYRWLPSDDLDIRLFMTISPYTIEKFYLAPLEPDIFGEYFVLWQLNKTGDFPILEKDKSKVSLHEVWNINPLRAYQFSVRLFQDFSFLPLKDSANNDQLTSLHFFTQNHFGNKTNNDSISWNSSLLETAIVSYSSNSRFTEAKILYYELCNLTSKYPQIQSYDIKSHAQLAILQALVDAKEFTSAEETYIDIVNLVKIIPYDSFRIRQMRAACKLFFGFLFNDNLVKAKEYYKKSILIYRSKDYVDFLLIEVEVSCALSSYLSKHGKIKEALKIFERCLYKILENPLKDIVYYAGRNIPLLHYHDVVVLFANALKNITYNLYQQRKNIQEPYFSFQKLLIQKLVIDDNAINIDYKAKLLFGIIGSIRIDNTYIYNDTVAFFFKNLTEKIDMKNSLIWLEAVRAINKSFFDNPGHSSMFSTTDFEDLYVDLVDRFSNDHIWKNDRYYEDLTSAAWVIYTR